MRDRDRRLAGGRHPSMSAGLSPASTHHLERSVGMELDLQHFGNNAELGGLGGADNGDAVRATVCLHVASGSTQPVV
jgi:hypothetical protein